MKYVCKTLTLLYKLDLTGFKGLHELKDFINIFKIFH